MVAMLADPAFTDLDELKAMLADPDQTPRSHADADCPTQGGITPAVDRS